MGREWECGGIEKMERKDSVVCGVECVAWRRGGVDSSVTFRGATKRLSIARSMTTIITSCLGEMNSGDRLGLRCRRRVSERKEEKKSEN